MENRWNIGWYAYGKDLCVGICGSSPKNLCAVGSTLFFTAYESDKGTELWKTDGTDKGTVRVKDINSGRSNFSPRYLCNVNNVLFFTADDGKNGAELWRSDGTEAGTFMVKDIDPAGSAHPSMLCAAKNVLFFKVTIKGEGESIWQSDGTANGTIKISSAHSIRNIGHVAYKQTVFWTDIKELGVKNQMGYKFELWAFTLGAKSPVLLVNWSQNSSAWPSLAFACGNNALFFSEGNTLWKSDGSTLGTAKIKSIPNVSYLNELQMIGDDLIFNAIKSINTNIKETRHAITTEISEYDVYISDGSIDGTNLLQKREMLRQAAFFKNNIIFYSNDLCKYDLKSSKPELKRIANGVDLPQSPNNFCSINNKLLFFASTPANGKELWWLDDKLSKAELLIDVNKKGNSFDVLSLTNVSNNLFVFCVNEVIGLQLWKSNGSKEGTLELKRLYPDYEYIDIEAKAELNGQLFFICKNDVKKKIDLWCSDGTANGTRVVRSFSIGKTKGLDQQLIAFKNKVYFNANEAQTGNEIWCSDGTEKGTYLIKDIQRGIESSAPQWFTLVGSTLYFAADNYNEGNELWKTDGTDKGTLMVHDVYNGAHSSDPIAFKSYNNKLFFAADNGLHGLELWQSDGTAAGTTMVSDINKGELGSNPEDLKVCGSLLFFTANNGKQGVELWKTDGKAEGTLMVADIYEGNEDSNPGELTVLNGELFFTANSNKYGVELWKSNGTEKATEMVKDIQKGSTGSNCRNLCVFNGNLYFVAISGLNDPELWKCNGKGSGTSMVQADYSSSNLLPPMFLCVSNNVLYYIVDMHEYGKEIWRLK